MKYTADQLKMFQADSRYTDNGFFNLAGYIETYAGRDWREQALTFIVEAGRNMGKSYGTWEFIENEIWLKSNFTQRIAYLRTNMTKLKSVKSFFNSKYAGKYLMTDTHIWKIELDEKGKEIKERRVELGAVIGVMNEENWRSGEFANYVMIFWDEYNESTTQPDLFTHFVNLTKTIERMTPNLLIVLVGNKINQSNDILVNLEIETPAYNEMTDEEKNDDFVFAYYDEDSGFPFLIFVSIAYNTFKHLAQENKLANRLASFNDRTNRFMNGAEYLDKKPQNVLLYRTKILPTRKIKFYVSNNENIFEYGSFERGVYFHKVEDKLPGYKTIALDLAGFYYEGDANNQLDKKDREDFAQLLINKNKNNQLFFTLYETKDEIEHVIFRHATLE